MAHLRTALASLRGISSIANSSSILSKGTSLSTLSLARFKHSNAISTSEERNKQKGLLLSGKVAVVTGSTSGIGLGVAQKLADNGCNIILNGFADEQLIQEITDDICSRGVQGQFVDADLSKLSEIEQLCEKVRRMYPGGPDIIINNAGLQHVSSLEEFPVDRWDLLVAVMLSAPFHLTRINLPGMRERGWGRIVNLASIHGLVASPNKSAYCSAKHGVLGLTKVTALETAGSGVTCNAICPGFVNTAIFQKQVKTRSESQGVSYEEASHQILQLVHPTCQVVEVDDVAELVAFVCSPSAAQMTGSILTMDAGWTAR